MIVSSWSKCVSTALVKENATVVKEQHKGEKLYHAFATFQASSRACSVSQKLFDPSTDSGVTLFNSLEALQGLGPLWGWWRSSFLLPTGPTPATAAHPPPWYFILSVRRSKLLWAFFWRWSCLLSFQVFLFCFKSRWCVWVFWLHGRLFPQVP